MRWIKRVWCGIGWFVSRLYCKVGNHDWRNGPGSQCAECGAHDWLYCECPDCIARNHSGYY